VDSVQDELRRLGTDIDRLDGVASDALGINRTDLRALDLIRSSGVSSPTTLASTMNLTTGGLTTVIDRLEAAGYIQRVADPRDRRRVVLEGTELIEAREAAIYGPLIAATVAVARSYTDAELATIRDYLARTRTVIAKHADRLIAGGPSSTATRR
jgi:DNA-binding MarR family transcriptional regulator